MYTLLAQKNVEDNWPVLAPWIAQAIACRDPMQECEEDLSVIKHKAQQGSMQIWVGEKDKIIDLVLITEGILLNKKPTLVVRWASGHGVIEDMMPDFGILEHWAKNHGFRKVQIWGRRGWTKLFRPLGYIHDFTIISKDIDRGIH